MSATAIIQARLDSTRLPRKVLLPLGGKPMIQQIIESLQHQKEITQIVLATSNDNSNDELSVIAKKTGIQYFEGSRENVLSRFYHVVEKFGGDYIIRVTGDNPFTSGSLAALAYNKAKKNNADLSSISGIPLGTAVEIIKADALSRCFHEAQTNYQKEHVTPYIKENPDKFSIIRYDSTIENPFHDLRLTVDTPEDYELAETIYKNIYKGYPLELPEVLTFIKDNLDLIKINSHIEQRPMTHAEK